MPIYVPGKVVLRKGWQPMDADAAAYITAVETADGQALEELTKLAIDNFVLGCKADGIWTAIKASCILAGARTRLGALTPLVGTAPTSFNFVDGDYNRKTGLVGNGSTKYLDSNRAGNADPQNSQHLSVFLNSVPGNCYIGSQSSASPTNISNGMIYTAAGQVNFRSRNANVNQLLSSSSSTGFMGVSRPNVSSQIARINSGNSTAAISSSTPGVETYFVFANNNLGGGPSLYSSARLTFYSIGESLNLALLDARVTDLINAFAAAIP
jgi:hypothetical protein